MVIASDFAAAREAEEALIRTVEKLGYAPPATFAIKLALEEALANAIKHGNGCDPNKQVEVEYDITPERSEFTVIDEGTGFCVQCVPDPTADENLERPGGRGIMLMRAFMDVVEYNEEGNRVHLVRKNTE